MGTPVGYYGATSRLLILNGVGGLLTIPRLVDCDGMNYVSTVRRTLTCVDCVRLIAQFEVHSTGSHWSFLRTGVT